MPGKPQNEQTNKTVKHEVTLGRAQLSYNGKVWSGTVRSATGGILCLAIRSRPLPTCGEGDTVTVAIPSATAESVTFLAKVRSAKISSLSGKASSTWIELESTRENDLVWMAFRDPMAALKPLILCVQTGETLKNGEFPGFRVETAVTLSEAVRVLKEDEVAVVVFGPSIQPSEIDALLQCTAEEAQGRSAFIVLYDETSPSVFQRLVDNDEVFYLTRASTASRELCETIAAAARDYLLRDGRHSSACVLSWEERVRVTEICLAMIRKGDLPGLTRAISAELTTLLRANHVRCLIYDSETNTLCEDGVEKGVLELTSAAAGLVGYVARTGEQVTVERVATDPRYDPDADNPEGALEAHFIAQPLDGPGGTTLGILTATRELDPFAEDDQICIEEVARIASAPLQVLLADRFTQRRLNQTEDGAQTLFRKEALDYQDHAQREGELLRGTPLWLTWSHLLIVLCLVISTGFVAFAKVHEIATGPAIVSMPNKISVRSQRGGVVEGVLVQPGDLVAKDELLAELSSAPGDPMLARVREEVRAPADGIVASLDIRTGQAVIANATVITLQRGASHNEVVAFLPGSYAPEIHVGMRLVLTIEGYPQSREELTIDDVAPDVVASDTAERYVDEDVAHSLPLNGPILIVRSALPRPVFETFGLANEKLRYYDGMVAHAEVSVGKEPLIVALVPGIKQLYSSSRISQDPSTGTDK